MTGLRKGRALAILWADVPSAQRADLEAGATSEPLAPADPEAGVLAVGRNEWYNTQHLIGNMTVNGMYSARRYLNRGTGPRYLTVYEFAHTEVSRQPAWNRARAQSVWWRRIERLWAHAPGSPGIYRRLVAR